MLAAVLLTARAQCTPLSSCTDTAPFGLGSCKTAIPGGFYCQDFTTYGTQCNACTCASGCQSDGGDGTPLNWRPGSTNPFGLGLSTNGLQSLSAAQQAEVVARHNYVRAYHGACPLEWSDEIAQNVASSALSTWQSQCALSHSTSASRTSAAGFSNLGENLATASSMYYASNFPVGLKTMAWYLEEPDWDYTTSTTRAGGGATGHFTQVVWKATTHVGCKMWQCPYSSGKKVLFACQYGPAGNVAGQYASNVGGRGSTAAGCAATRAPTAVGDTSPPTTGSPTAPQTAPPFLLDLGATLQELLNQAVAEVTSEIAEAAFPTGTQLTAPAISGVSVRASFTTTAVTFPSLASTYPDVPARSLPIRLSVTLVLADVQANPSMWKLSFSVLAAQQLNVSYSQIAKVVVSVGGNPLGRKARPLTAAQIDFVVCSKANCSDDDGFPAYAIVLCIVLPLLAIVAVGLAVYVTRKDKSSSPREELGDQSPRREGVNEPVGQEMAAAAKKETASAA